MQRFTAVCLTLIPVTVAVTGLVAARPPKARVPARTSVRTAVAFDLSAPLEQFIPDKAIVIHPAVESPKELQGSTKGPGTGLSATPPPPPPAGRGGGGAGRGGRGANPPQFPPPPPSPEISPAAALIEQTSHGDRPAIPAIAGFDGLGEGFTGRKFPGAQEATSNIGGRGGIDISLAVGPNHIFEVLNGSMAIFSKKGKKFAETGNLLYGAVPNNTIFSGFGVRCGVTNNSDTVVRYDQLADRWLFVLPVFSRPPGNPQGPYAMCYAVSATPDPLGPYYRYEFQRPLFPAYPRPAVWPDGYYNPTSTGDNLIQKHICIADRTRMLRGEPATEQCIIIDGVNFLNNADIDGQGVPPAGAPNIMIAAGGTQLKKVLDDDGIYVWKVHVDWENPKNTAAIGPEKIAVAPYHYLC